MRLRGARILVVVLVVVAAAGGGVWWFVLRDTAPSKASLANLEAGTTTVAPGASSTGAPGLTDTNGSTSAGASPDGTWKLVAGAKVFAGYRINEQFAGDSITKTAVGRSPAVTGSLTLAGSKLAAASLTVDTTQLASDSGRRDNFIRSNGLETTKFPTATFVITAPVDLTASPTVGAALTPNVIGTLTLHGVTKSVTAAIQAKWDGSVVNVAGSIPITLADYGITPPDIGGFVSVADKGTVEFQLQFIKS